MGIIITILVLSLLVFVHEFGHFIAARKIGVEVEEFGFGFPPRLWGKKRGNTIYSINWIPLGGFVRLKGEKGDFSHHHDSLNGRKAFERAIIVSAGVLMNFLLAAVLFAIGVFIGMPREINNLPSYARVRAAEVVITDFTVNSPAKKAGIEAGDYIVSINNQNFKNSQTVQNFLSDNAQNAVQLQVRRGSETKIFDLTPITLEETGKPGIGVGLLSVGIVSYPWYIAPIEGVTITFELIGGVIKAFIGLFRDLIFTGKLSNDVSGPIGIAVLTGQVAALGFVYLLQFVALLSVNLGVINFLPFPALDGGRFLFLIIEKVRGRPVSIRIENAIHQFGFILLLALIALVTYRDVGKFLIKQ